MLSEYIRTYNIHLRFEIQNRLRMIHHHSSQFIDESLFLRLELTSYIPCNEKRKHQMQRPSSKNYLQQIHGRQYKY